MHNHNDIYLIIKNEEVMAQFLKLLIFKTSKLDAIDHLLARSQINASKSGSKIKKGRNNQ